MKGDAAEKRAEENEVKENAASAAPLPSAAAAAAAAPAAPTSGEQPAAASSGSGSGGVRKPFTQLSQIESDMALARALQEQERAYLILRSSSNYVDMEESEQEDGDEDDDEDEDEDDEEEDDEDDEQDQEDEQQQQQLLLLPQEATAAAAGAAAEDQLQSDEAFARALQEAEVQESTARMMALAGIHDEFEDDGFDEDRYLDDVDAQEYEDGDDDGGDDGSESDDQEMWEDVDPDNMTYEELIALGEIAGTANRGLAATTIAELPVTSYTKENPERGSSTDHEQCVICRLDYEENEQLLTLPCKHNYHSECIQQWLQINKVCPVCSAEVGSGGSTSSS